MKPNFPEKWQSPNYHLEVLDDLQAISLKAASIISASAQTAWSKGRFSLVLAGGNTPRMLHDILCSSQHPFMGTLPWGRIHFFWGDERHVPPDHSASNFDMVMTTLLSRVPVPVENIHRMCGEMFPIEAASRYEKHCREFFNIEGTGFPRFDLIVLGMGSDGHTASLFPGSEALQETSRWVLGVPGPTDRSQRITLTPPVLNAARAVLFLVAGEDKATALREVLYGDHDPEKWPAQIVQPRPGRMIWLVDRAAAKELKS